MNFSEIFLRRGFARVSPFFAALSVAACLSLPAFARAESTARTSATTKQQAAEAQFAKAEELRAALASKPSDQRALADYKQVVSSYRRVYLITPRSPSVADALFAVAELYTEMGARFGRNYFQLSVEAYQFLIREYPSNKYRQDATLRIAKLQRDRLGETSLAYQTYQDFLKRFPRTSHRREVQEALAELSLLLRNGSDDASAKAPAKNAPARGQTAKDESAAGNDSSGGTGTLPRDGAIPRVRRISASATPDATRVTIDLEDPVQYRSARIKNPDRIFFDFHSARLTPEVARGEIHVEGDLLKSIRVAQNQAGVVRVVLNVNGVKDYTASLLNDPPRLVIELYASEKALRAAKARTAAPGEAGADLPEASPRTESPETASRTRSLKAATDKPDFMKPVGAAKPTRDGQATLTRTLGLKIGRIVIDPGHGGHDTGTIGPSGLMEKDLCLDIALRLGKIIQQRLPGAEVVYTRSDDSFIPLEERTRIANDTKADLFISIHANSSRDRNARGIETYYLNLKGTPEAMEVAARENATSQEAVHDLQDLVKQIARTEKIDESREFAEDVQDALSKHILRTARTARNRGVRKAPFVVLIGADMPSILTEISFLSNPGDERQLKKPDQRQSVAEGIYQGVASYLQSLNSVTVNLSPNPVARRTAGSVPLEQSRNQN